MLAFLQECIVLIQFVVNIILTVVLSSGGVYLVE